MAIYFDNGKTVKEYLTSEAIENAVAALLEADCKLTWRETHDGYHVEIRADKDDEE